LWYYKKQPAILKWRVYIIIYLKSFEKLRQKIHQRNHKWATIFPSQQANNAEKRFNPAFIPPIKYLPSENNEMVS
jgi:hypothetical protein